MVVRPRPVSGDAAMMTLPALAHLGMRCSCAATVAALSSATLATPAPSTPYLAGSSWSGACPQVKVGTYAFTFAPGTSDSGSVRIGFPDRVTPQTVHYTVTPTADSGRQLVIGLDPPWHGEVTQDARILDWNFQIGPSESGHRCHLVRQKTLSP